MRFIDFIELYPLQALRRARKEYKLGSLRYDLWKLRAKHLVSGKHSSFPPLPAPSSRLSDLPGVPEAL